MPTPIQPVKVITVHRLAAERRSLQAQEELRRQFGSWPVATVTVEQPKAPKVRMASPLSPWTIAETATSVAARILPPLVSSCANTLIPVAAPGLLGAARTLMHRGARAVAQHSIASELVAPATLLASNGVTSRSAAVRDAKLNTEWLSAIGGRAALGADPAKHKRAREQFVHSKRCQNIYFNQLQQAAQLALPPLVGVAVGTMAAAAWPVIVTMSCINVLAQCEKPASLKAPELPTSDPQPVPAQAATDVPGLMARAGLVPTSELEKELENIGEKAPATYRQMFGNLWGQLSSQMMFLINVVGPKVLVPCMAGLAGFSAGLPTAVAGTILALTVVLQAYLMHVSRKAGKESVKAVEALTRLDASLGVDKMRFSADGKSISKEEFVNAVVSKTCGHFRIDGASPSLQTDLLCLLKEYFHDDSTFVPHHQDPKLAPIKAGNGVPPSGSWLLLIKEFTKQDKAPVLLLDNCRSNLNSKRRRTLDKKLVKERTQRCIIETFEPRV